jgi:hypothetical protein
MKPDWKILVVLAGQPETLLEASRSWSWEQRLSARVSFSLVYHAMLNDLMKSGKPRRVYSNDLAGTSLRAHAWRTGNDVCLYVSSVTFDGELLTPDDCYEPEVFEHEVFDQTSVSVITGVGKTWVFEQTQGNPILSPSLLAGDDLGGDAGGWCEDGPDSDYDEGLPLLERTSAKQWSRLKILRG